MRNVFPESRPLLCTLHLATAQWRWLRNSSNGVSAEDRQHMQELFTTLVYAQSYADYDKGRYCRGKVLVRIFLQLLP